MENPEDVARRLMALEIKASYAEDLLDQLNQTVYRQQTHIDALLREVAELRRQLPEGTSPVLRSLRDDLPPHY
jgi:SlyX protein